MLDISSHVAVRKGLVAVDHSIAGMQNSDVIDPAKVKYCIVNPHSPGIDFAFPRDIEKYLPQDAELFKKYLKSENDSGIFSLTRILLDQYPGGLALTVEPSRGVIDANRMKASMAVRNILSPETPDAVRDILRRMHGEIFGALDHALDALPEGTKILDLHSMEPFSTPNQPALAHDNLEAFLQAYGTRPLNDETRRPVDIITGTKGQKPVADMFMSRKIAELLRGEGFSVDYNTPYDTNIDYPDFDYMVRFPKSTLAVDFRKTDLCEGSGEDRSFDTTNPVIDEKKIHIIAELLQEALQQSRKKIMK